MKRLFRELVVFSACTLGLAALSSEAFADCSSMFNAEWNSLSTTMASQYDEGQYEEALNTGKRLSLICPRSPVVNYTMSEIYRKMDNEADAATYAKKATEYITDYPVPQALAERIWMRRAEYDLPYKGELEALQAKTADYDEIKANYESLQAAQHEAAIRGEYESQAAKEHSEKLRADMEHSWRAGLWSGVGVLGLGAVMSIVGGVLTVKSDKIDYSRSKNPKWSGFSVNQGYVTGFALLGAGVGLAAAGAVLTGISGYKLSHLDLDGDGVEDESVSFNVSPTSIQFGMTF